MWPYGHAGTTRKIKSNFIGLAVSCNSKGVVMHSVDENGNVCVNLNDYNHLSDSILFREKIDFLTDKLHCPKAITNFSISFLFKSGKRHYISNLYLWAIPYRTEGLYRADIDHDISLYNGKEFFIQTNIKYDFTQQPIINILESRYQLHTTFAMIRQCYDCDLIIEVFNKEPVNEPEKLYFEIRDQFEKFIVCFLNEMEKEITSALWDHQDLDFFQNKEFRKKVITRQLNSKKPILTDREIDCLRLLTQGLATKNVADELNLSVETVNTHTKSIRRKLGCSNITQSVAIGIKIGLIKNKISPNFGMGELI
jgi:DNA-binding CsgD family transcriptional regulator